MPESVPGPEQLELSSGKDGSTSFQLVTLEPGSQIFFSCSVVRQSTQSLSLFTTTVSASFATWNSTGSIPASSQIVASSSLIGREAFERSVSSRQNRSKPPPVPETPTVTWTPGSWPWNFSAAAVVYGPTVLEPSASIRPERSPPPPLDSVVVPDASVAAAAAAAGEESHQTEQHCNLRDRFSVVRHTTSLAGTLRSGGCRPVNMW